MTNQVTESHYKQRIFAVDIGTRSVIGLVGYFEDGKLVVEHGEVLYHKDRVMIDGQIHEIDGVAESIKLIKEKLEQACGQTFTEVAIAAAGRSLVTARYKQEQDIDELIPIKKNVIDQLESECLQNVYAKMLEESSEMRDYFCIGHTVINYYLNDKMMLSLQGHKGNKIGVDLVATFLPRTVVDSLYTAVSHIGLDVSYLTLEPIAAIEVAVPSNIRLLNIALVDIGAGTSDIAITKDGTVIAYAMTSTAGDEITEALAKLYLLDFDSAEILKCNLSEHPTQKFKDIFGMEQEKSTEEILDQLMDVIDLIAKNIADNVIEKNGKSPSAVFLTGGGSKIPRLNQVLAKYFDLPIERVSTRDMTYIPNLDVKNFSLSGPEVITPIGILAKAISHYGKDFIEVYVNGANVKLFNTKKLMVVDAMTLVGINPNSLISKAGKTITVHINGQIKKLFGEIGEHGVVYVNEKPASISTLIKEHDQIEIVPAKNGADPDIQLRKLVPMGSSFVLNGVSECTITNLRVNGLSVPDNVKLNDQDAIEFDQIITIGDLRRRSSISNSFKVIANGIVVKDTYTIKENDVIETSEGDYQHDKVDVLIENVMDANESNSCKSLNANEDFIQSNKQLSFEEVIIESEVVEVRNNFFKDDEEEKSILSKESTVITDEDSSQINEKKNSSKIKKESSFISILYNGSPIKLPGENPLVFVNLFDYIDFDRSRPQGNLHMTQNGQPVSYFSPVQDGDVIEIKWVESVEMIK